MSDSLKVGEALEIEVLDSDDILLMWRSAGGCKLSLEGGLLKKGLLRFCFLMLLSDSSPEEDPTSVTPEGVWLTLLFNFLGRVMATGSVVGPGDGDSYSPISAVL